MTKLPLILAATLLAGPGFAQTDLKGDAAAGEEKFNRQCVTCHVVRNEAGETLAGRRARTGPNLYGVAGRVAGSVEGFRYGSGMEMAHEAGIRWTEENFAAYVQDPTGFLREALGDDSVRGRMAFRVRDEQAAYDIYAYLASLAPAPEGDEAESDSDG